MDGSKPASRKKPRPDDVLGNLPEADQQQVIAWIQLMSFRDAVDQIAKPRPEGLGLKTYLNSLRRFYMKHLDQDLLSDSDSASDLDQLETRNSKLETNPSAHGFALVCSALEREVLMGLDRLEGRDHTIKLLSLYLRAQAIEQKKAKRNFRDRFRPQFVPFEPPLPAEPVSTGNLADVASGAPNPFLAPNSEHAFLSSEHAFTHAGDSTRNPHLALQPNAAPMTRGGRNFPASEHDLETLHNFHQHIQMLPSGPLGQSI